jgi:hypothetical protein
LIRRRGWKLHSNDAAFSADCQALKLSVGLFQIFIAHKNPVAAAAAAALAPDAAYAVDFLQPHFRARAE